MGTLVFLVTGCARDLPTSYATFREASVNGLDVFARMVRDQGSEVRLARALSPKLRENTDVLCWFVDDFDQLDPQAAHWIRDWLERYPDRQLLLVFRDCDMEIAYWRDLLEQYGETLSESERERVATAQSAATNRLLRATSEPLKPAEEPWCGLRAPREKEIRWLDRLQGASWCLEDAGVEPGGLEVPLRRGLDLGKGAFPILYRRFDVLAARQVLGQGAVWTFANGSLLLNYGLVNHEHRKIAMALAGVIGAGRRWTFLRSDAVLPSDAAPESDGILRYLTVPPISWVAGHLLALALLFALYRFPIFGRPREIETREVYRFGRHVEAMGALLEKTGRLDGARAQVERYAASHEQPKEKR